MLRPLFHLIAGSLLLAVVAGCGLTTEEIVVDSRGSTAASRRDQGHAHLPWWQLAVSCGLLHRAGPAGGSNRSHSLSLTSAFGIATSPPARSVAGKRQNPRRLQTTVERELDTAGVQPQNESRTARRQWKRTSASSTYQPSDFRASSSNCSAATNASEYPESGR